MVFDDYFEEALTYGFSSFPLLKSYLFDFKVSGYLNEVHDEKYRDSKYWHNPESEHLFFSANILDTETVFRGHFLFN